MSTHVLVTYASKYGATQEIAEEIGQVLNQAGLPTDVLRINLVSDLSRYQAIVLGSAVYIGKWRKEAVRFLKANEKKLSGMPIWLFSSGPTGEGDPVELLNGWRLPMAIQPIVDRIKPRGISVFHGNVNVSKLNSIEKSILKNVEAPIGDFRNWDAIRSWANAVADDLSSSTVASVT
ncbi:MAG: flavodoxin domain-containing protein [Anaerolineales bacterium]|nr:flavodoxin domain-containing protein [Anaerolineales bacterium]